VTQVIVILFCAFQLLITIVLLNLLIAILNDTCDILPRYKQLEWQRQPCHVLSK
jgi:hypothetical protein